MFFQEDFALDRCGTWVRCKLLVQQGGAGMCHCGSCRELDPYVLLGSWPAMAVRRMGQLAPERRLLEASMLLQGIPGQRAAGEFCVWPSWSPRQELAVSLCTREIQL